MRITCPTCEGETYLVLGLPYDDDTTYKVKCPTCAGEGEVEQCQNCNGTGKVRRLFFWKANCSSCRGHGFLSPYFERVISAQSA